MTLIFEDQGFIVNLLRFQLLHNLSHIFGGYMGDHGSLNNEQLFLNILDKINRLVKKAIGLSKYHPSS